jgi:hypothetical protein
MQIIGFTLTKVLIERKDDIKGKWKVTSKIDVKDIKEEKIEIAVGKGIAKADFEYTINYEPELGEIFFKGFILILGEPDEIKSTISDWKKKKIMLSDIKLRIFNTIFQKCNIKALELEEDFNLPPHIKLPLIKSEEETKKTPSSYTG